MNNLALILVVICSFSLVFSIVSTVLGIVVIGKLKELSKVSRMPMANQPVNTQPSAMVQRTSVPQNSRNLSSQGVVICKNCYSSIPDNVKICPCCQASVDRR